MARPIWGVRDRDTNGDGTLDERLYVMQDANYNVTGLLDNSGNVVERYVYDPFGAVTVLDANWNVLAASAFAWVYLHQGGRFDATSGLYHFRFRDYSLSLGRWTTLDPLGYDAGDVNLYRALGNGLPNRLDPSGLLWSWVCAGIGALSGGVGGVVGYFGYTVITGRPITLGGAIGAAAGGAMAGGIAGGFVGAGTGDPTALVVGGVLVGAGSGAVGGFTSSVVAQGIDQGQIDWGQVADDTASGAVIGGVTGGVTGGVLGVVGRAGRVVPNEINYGQAGRTVPAIDAPRTVADVLKDGGKSIGKPGRSPGVRIVSSEAELKSLFDELSKGGTVVPSGTYPGTIVKMPDGTRVMMRPTSKSGGATIDIHGPGGEKLKIHIE